MNDSAIICDKKIESYDKETKTVPTNFNENKSVKCKILYFTFICINYCGIAVSIYCYLIKYQAKQKYLLPFHITNNEFKEFMY